MVPPEIFRSPSGFVIDRRRADGRMESTYYTCTNPYPVDSTPDEWTLAHVEIR
jgi:hypothetical protein